MAVRHDNDDDEADADPDDVHDRFGCDEKQLQRVWKQQLTKHNRAYITGHLSDTVKYTTDYNKRDREWIKKGASVDGSLRAFLQAKITAGAQRRSKKASESGAWEAARTSAVADLVQKGYTNASLAPTAKDAILARTIVVKNKGALPKREKEGKIDVLNVAKPFYVGIHWSSATTCNKPGYVATLLYLRDTLKLKPVVAWWSALSDKQKKEKEKRIETHHKSNNSNNNSNNKRSTSSSSTKTTKRVRIE